MQKQQIQIFETTFIQIPHQNEHYHNRHRDI